MEAINASMLCADRVLPLASLNVADTINGMETPLFSNTSKAAARAALATSVSNTVSIRSKSTLPSSKPSICRTYICINSSYVCRRYSGSSTEGENDAELPVGPKTPATNAYASGWFCSYSSTAALAISAAARFKS